MKVKVPISLIAVLLCGVSMAESAVVPDTLRFSPVKTELRIDRSFNMHSAKEVLEQSADEIVESRAKPSVIAWELDGNYIPMTRFADAATKLNDVYFIGLAPL